MADRCKTIDDLTQLLEHLLGTIIDIDDHGQITEGRKRVEQIGSLTIVIRPVEHAPPHFHVTGPDINASFRISDGTQITGHIGRREIKILNLWFPGARRKLISFWNDTRPSDCPVGPITE